MASMGFNQRDFLALVLTDPSRVLTGDFPKSLGKVKGLSE